MSDSIPDEIYVDIFLKVPTISILACKFVCRTWYSLISNPSFVKRHLNLTIQQNKPNLMLKGYEKSKRTPNLDLFYSIPHDSIESLLSTDNFLDHEAVIDYPFKSLGYTVEVMCCCDGLVCLWFEGMRLFCIWNPVTREYKILPKSMTHHRVTAVAFSYDHKTDDYKLVVCCESVFEVLSLRLNSWKSIENVPSELFLHFMEPGVLVNGNPHWLPERKDFSYALISMDISNETFKELELPRKKKSGYFFHSLGVLKECLCFLEDYEYSNHINIWVMQNYGVGESWTKRYTVQSKIIMDACFVRVMEFDEILLLSGGGEYDDLVLYDPKNGSVRETNISSLANFYEKEFCFESLVSLNSGTYVGGQEQIQEPDKKKMKTIE